MSSKRYDTRLKKIGYFPVKDLERPNAFAERKVEKTNKILTMSIILLSSFEAFKLRGNFYSTRVFLLINRGRVLDGNSESQMKRC